MASQRCIAEITTYIASCYPVTFTPTDLTVWHDVLSDCDDEAVIAATRELCRRDTQWSPRPGEIRSAALPEPEERTYLAHYHRPFGQLEANVSTDPERVQKAFNAARLKLRGGEGA